MVRVIISGCNGRMGQVVSGLVKEDPDMEAVAGIDVAGEGNGDYPVFHSPDMCQVPADVVIDFSSPKAFDGLMDYCAAKRIPAVVCTTGLSEEQVKRLGQVSEQTAMLRSANMSLGINVLMKLVKEAARALTPAGFDVEIVEKHHNKKKDAPSGTALSLADSVNEASDGRYHYVYDRSGRYEQRDGNELGISSVRGGTIVGEHEVIFAGTDEVIELRHTAYSRAIFAKGAIAAAKFLAGKDTGLYDMADVIG